MPTQKKALPANKKAARVLYKPMKTARREFPFRCIKHEPSQLVKRHDPGAKAIWSPDEEAMDNAGDAILNLINGTVGQQEGQGRTFLVRVEIVETTKPSLLKRPKNPAG